MEDEAVAFYTVEAIEGFRENDGSMQFAVRWQRFSEISWEPIEVMHKDCQELVEKYVMEMEDKKMRNRLRRVLRM